MTGHLGGGGSRGMGWLALRQRDTQRGICGGELFILDGTWLKKEPNMVGG